jgi:hypothetical protein
MTHDHIKTDYSKCNQAMNVLTYQNDHKSNAKVYWRHIGLASFTAISKLKRENKIIEILNCLMCLNALKLSIDLQRKRSWVLFWVLSHKRRGRGDRVPQISWGERQGGRELNLSAKFKFLISKFSINQSSSLSFTSQIICQKKTTGTLNKYWNYYIFFRRISDHVESIAFTLKLTIYLH